MHGIWLLVISVTGMVTITALYAVCNFVHYVYEVFRQISQCDETQWTLLNDEVHQADLLLPHKTPQNCGMLNLKFIVSRFFLLTVIHNNIV